jgi:rubrerythrin
VTPPDDYDDAPMERPKSTTDIVASPAGPGRTRCTITWQRTPVTVSQTITPTCCPQGRRGQPCPKPITQQVQGERTLVETVRIAEDGTATRERVQLVTRGPPVPPRHMCGRRPEGFVLDDHAVEAGDVLSAMAALEAASVIAFERLARELAHHDAPPELVEEAKAAARDEVRHARTMRRLARRFGSTDSAEHEICSAESSLPVRALDALAHENAVEGCVFETWGALTATFQAERAATPELRRAFAAIARDERRHATLAHHVHEWASGRLPQDAREAVAAARREAITALGASVHGDASVDEASINEASINEASINEASVDEANVDDAKHLLGLPRPNEAAALYRAWFAA